MIFSNVCAYSLQYAFSLALLLSNWFVSRGGIVIRIIVVRHGETGLNSEKRMQSITDAPINEFGVLQAKQLQTQMKNECFDAVYASPFSRTITTAAIIANINESEIIKDARLSEVYFGKYELKRFCSLGVPMTLHWLYPEVFRSPKTVESLQSVITRVSSFLTDLRSKDYENVLICSHGNLIRVLNHVLGGGAAPISWRTFPKNCTASIFYFS